PPSFRVRIRVLVERFGPAIAKQLSLRLDHCPGRVPTWTPGADNMVTLGSATGGFGYAEPEKGRVPQRERREATKLAQGPRAAYPRLSHHVRARGGAQFVRSSRQSVG